MSAITMQELELETAELLPARETLWFFSSQRNTAVIGNGNGNTSQQGVLNVSALNGFGNGNGNVVIQSNG
jgi:hypothetical protein